ncbi:protein-glutamate O-methyltransferase CheR [Phenylobacterium sp. LjRoot225]|uniref:CheR family methyltransferase n=1 Tax=Phenylobacterium sp. LjRoot225 TaxID=3342285 RepID=UPI003ECE28AF
MTTAPADHELARFRDLLTARLGLQIDTRRLSELPDLLARRIEAGASSAGAYLRKLEVGPSQAEIGALAAELTVPETYFFRNMDQFRAFRDAVLPDRLARAPLRKLRILSAGCATGEEAYSIAMIARDVADDPSARLSIRAVDINPVALRKAAQARYSEWALRETPPDLRRRWFRSEGAQRVLADEVKALVVFEQRNLVGEETDLWGPEPYDVVFCRNVLMYYAPEIACRVVARIAAALAPDGYLFLGHAETLRGVSQDFHLLHTHGTFYYQRKSETERTAIDPARRAVEQHAPVADAPPRDGWFAAILHSTERVGRLTKTAARPDADGPRRDPASDVARVFDLLARDRFGEALELMDRLPAAVGEDPDILLLRATLLVHSDRATAAEQACRRLLEIDEMNASAHHVLALCREATGDHRAAADAHQVAAYLDPTFAMPRLHLGRLARQAGAHETASRELRHALLLLQREDTSRLLLFGGGFTRAGLIGLCRAELDACERGP